MVQRSLLQGLEDLAGRVRSLEREKGEAVARIQALESENREAISRTQALEREVSRLISLITMAGEKVEEILKVGANDGIPQPPAISVPEESDGHQQLGEFSADQKKKPKRLYPQSCIPD